MPTNIFMSYRFSKCVIRRVVGVFANHYYCGAETQSASPFEELSVTADCEMLANRPGPWAQSPIFVL